MAKSSRKRAGRARPATGLPDRAGTPARARLPATPTQDRERYVELFTHAPIGYVLVDLDGVILEINQTGRTLIGMTTRSPVGRSLAGFVGKSHRAKYLEHMRRVRETDGTVDTELTLRTRDGRLVPVLMSTRRPPRREQDVCWTVIVDQTERHRLTEARRRAEQQRIAAEQEQLAARARSEAKDRFLATLSHELRTPLTPTLFAAAMLLKSEKLPAGAVKMVEMIKRNVELEAGLIDDLLDVTRIVRHRLQIHRTVVDAHVIIDDCVGICRASAEEKHLALAFRPAAQASLVEADPIRIRQVIWNLLSNAVKFTPPGGRVTVSTANQRRGLLRISVSDTGIGIEPETLANLFAPFEKASAERPESGLGLGLAICRGIMDAHGGRIRASSAGRGGGARFDVELATVRSRTAFARRTRERAPSAQASSYRILVVEDHEDTAEMLATWLARQGHVVETATSLERAIDCATREWDVIISDLRLPDGSGLDLARHVRASARPPRCLIAVSGYGARSDVDASREAGFDTHLIKPVDVRKLLAILQRLDA